MLPPAAHLTSSCVYIFGHKIHQLYALELGSREDNFVHGKQMQKLYFSASALTSPFV